MKKIIAFAVALLLCVTAYGGRFGGGSSGGGRSFSSGSSSRSFSSGSSSRSFSSGSSSRSFSSGSNSRFGGGSTGSRFGGGSKPSGSKVTGTSPPKSTSTFGSSLGKARAVDQSGAQKSAYTPPTKSFSSSQASTRTTRITKVYNVNSYGGWRVHTYSHDPYHPMLTGYLLGRLNSNYDATRWWIYNNYDSLDPLRREELFRENARLRADIATMRSQHLAANPSYGVGIDDDLLYSDAHASSLYGPSWTFYGFFKFLFWTTVVCTVIFIVVYLACFHEFGE